MTTEQTIGQDNTKLLEGRQLVTEGNVIADDIIIWPNSEVDPFPEQCIGWNISSGMSAFRVYRKMDTAHNLDRPMNQTPEPAKPINVCREAEKLVLGDRNESYGSPADDYTKTAKVWSGLLAHKLKHGVEITPKEAVLMMAAMKISREMHKHKRDNLVDCAGYVLCAEWIQNGEKPFVP